MDSQLQRRERLQVPGPHLRHWRQRPAGQRREVLELELLAGLWLQRALWRLARQRERARLKALLWALELQEQGKVAPLCPPLPPNREVRLQEPTRPA